MSPSHSVQQWIPPILQQWILLVYSEITVPTEWHHMYHHYIIVHSWSWKLEENAFVFCNPVSLHRGKNSFLVLQTVLRETQGILQNRWATKHSHSIPSLSWHSEQCGGQRVASSSGRTYADPQQLAVELLPHQYAHSCRPHGGHSDSASREKEHSHKWALKTSELTLKLLCKPD